MYIPKLRKQENIAKDIKKIDKNTAITGYLIEKLAKEGKITRIKYGNAWLVNIDEIADFFNKRRKNEKSFNWNYI